MGLAKGCTGKPLRATSPLQARTAAGAAAFASDSSKAATLFWAYVSDVRAGRWPSGSSDVLNDAALGPLPETPGSTHYPTGFEAWLRWREAVRRRKARSLARWRRSKDAEWGAQRAASATAVPLAVAERVVVGKFQALLSCHVSLLGSGLSLQHLPIVRNPKFVITLAR